MHPHVCIRQMPRNCKVSRSSVEALVKKGASSIQLATASAPQLPSALIPQAGPSTQQRERNKRKKRKKTPHSVPDRPHIFGASSPESELGAKTAIVAYSSFS